MSMSKSVFRPCAGFRRHLPGFGVIFIFAFLGLGGIWQAQTSLAAANGSGERGSVLSRQSVRAQVNSGGPEDWPETGGISTATPAPSAAGAGQARPALPSGFEQPVAPLGQDFERPAAPMREPAAPSYPAYQEGPAQPAPQYGQERPEPEARQIQAGGRTAVSQGLPGAEKQAVEQPGQAQREVIYVDEQGNQVPKPLEPEKMLAEAQELMDNGKFDDALPILEKVRGIPSLAPGLLENALYGISDCIWARYAENPLAGYEPIVASTNEALNANLRSPRVPDALLRLGLANINVGNLGDASGYIVALMRRFPDYPGVAQGFTALGKARLKEGKYAEAEQAFGIVLDKYPESSQLQDASVGLATALVKQGKDERAQVIMDFISKRWPRYYIGDPDFLLMQAANEERLKRIDAAMDVYWLFVNLEPKRKGNDELLLKMGDSYSRRGSQDAANFIYNEIDQNFGDTPAAVKARVRLAEKGVYDSPIKYEEMSKVFDKSERPTLWQVYSELADSSQTNPDAILARLKLAMWLYWDKRYPEAMGKAADFIDAYPENPETPEARNVLWDAFKKEMEQSLAEHNYGRILLLWNGFPLVRERYGKIDPPLRYALAQGWLERGDEQKSFELMADFLKDPMDPEYGEAVFSQFFSHYLENSDWNKILELGRTVRNWKMRPELQNQLDYGMALSAQNLNLGAPALNRWKKLAAQTDIPLYQQAYAMYFLAKDAENRRDIRNAYERNRKVIEMFTKLADERSDKADPERIKEATAALMDICEVGNRIPEALQWVERYGEYAPKGSPEYPGLRFREARLYRKLGDSSRAQALLEDIVSNFSDSPFAQAAAGELRTFDVSRDLQRYMPESPAKDDSRGSGSTSGNWSSSGPVAQEGAKQ